MKTTENNKIIAEFMGLNKTKMFFNLKSGNYVKKETDDCDIKAVDVYLKNNKPITNFYYHSDWNWLMEVVEKIEGLHVANNVFIVSNTIIHIHNKYTNELDVFIGKQQFANVAENKKENTYNACLEFIKWYNEQNKV